MPAGATVSASGTIPAAAPPVRRSRDLRPSGRGGGSRYVPQPEVIRNAAPASRGARHRSQGIAAVPALPVVVGGGAARGLRARRAGLPPRGRWRLGAVEGRPSRRPALMIPFAVGAALGVRAGPRRVPRRMGRPRRQYRPGSAGDRHADGGVVHRMTDQVVEFIQTNTSVLSARDGSRFRPASDRAKVVVVLRLPLIPYLSRKTSKTER